MCCHALSQEIFPTRDQAIPLKSPALAGRFFNTSAPRKPLELPYVPTILLLLEGNKITISKRYMYHHVHCSTIYNNQNGNNLCPLTLNGYVDAQLLSYVRLFVTPWTAAHQAFLSFIISQSLLKLMSIESVLPSNHLVFCYPLSSCLQSFPASGSFLMN